MTRYKRAQEGTGKCVCRGERERTSEGDKELRKKGFKVVEVKKKTSGVSIRYAHGAGVGDGYRKVKGGLLQRQ